MKVMMLLSAVNKRYLIIMLLLIVSSMHYGRAVAGIEFLSISDDAVIMYDAPSLMAEKLFVVSRHFPVEAIVNTEYWIKILDNSGSLAWVEKKFLSNQRYVIATVPQADIYQAADENSALVFQVQEQVVLEWIETTSTGWVKVRHRDGQTGYIRASQVWGS